MVGKRKVIESIFYLNFLRINNELIAQFHDLA
jgi:hypothetical protein